MKLVPGILIFASFLWLAFEQDAFTFHRGKAQINSRKFSAENAIKAYYSLFVLDRAAFKVSEAAERNLPACEKESSFEFPAPSAISGSCEFVVVNKSDADRLRVKQFIMHSPSAEFQEFFKITCVPAKVTVRDGKVKVIEGKGALK